MQSHSTPQTLTSTSKQILHYNKHLHHSCWYLKGTVYKAMASCETIKGRGSNALCKRSDSGCVYTAHLSSALNGSSEISRFKRADTIEIRNGITFVFYSGLPHIHLYYTLKTPLTHTTYYWSTFHNYSNIQLITINAVTLHTTNPYIYKQTNPPLLQALAP